MDDRTQANIKTGHDGAAESGGVVSRSLWNKLALASAVLLSAVLGLAAYAKFTQPDKGKRLFFDGPGDTDYLLQDPIIAGIEVAVILALLLGHRLRIAWAAVMLMFGGFSGYALFYMLRGESCGCFGELFTIPAWGTLMIDIVAVGVGAALLALRNTGARSIGMTVAASAVMGIAGYGFATMTAPLTARQIEEQQLREQQAAEPPTDRSEEIATEPDDDAASEGAEPAAASVVPADAPGRRDGFTAAERLLRSDLLAQVSAASIGENAPAFYVFVWDPDCPTCVEKMPFVTEYRVMYPEDDPVLRVVDVQKLDAEREAGIEYSAWDGSPTAFIVRQGKVTNIYRDDATPSPDEIRGELDFGLLGVGFPE